LTFSLLPCLRYFIYLIADSERTFEEFSCTESRLCIWYHFAHIIVFLLMLAYSKPEAEAFESSIGKRTCTENLPETVTDGIKVNYFVKF
jgi:hypothetical protein